MTDPSGNQLVVYPYIIFPQGFLEGQFNPKNNLDVITDRFSLLEVIVLDFIVNYITLTHFQTCL